MYSDEKQSFKPVFRNNCYVVNKKTKLVSNPAFGPEWMNMYGLAPRVVI